MKLRRPEQQLHIAVVRWLHLAGVAERAIFFHPYNGGKRTKAEASIGRAFGVRPGVADLVFVWRGDDGEARVGFVELKAPGGRSGPSANQKLFRADCEALGAGYAVARSIEDVDAALRDWGVPRKTLGKSNRGGSDVGVIHQRAHGRAGTGGLVPQ